MTVKRIFALYWHNSVKETLNEVLKAEAENGFHWRGVVTIINPKALIEHDYITAAQEEDLAVVVELYNNEAAKISPILSKFG